MTHPPPPVYERPPWNWIRRAVAGLLLLALAAVVAWSYVPGAAIASCHQELAAGGAIVKVCGPIGGGDVVGVGLILLIAGLLVWPDLSELGIPGLIALKRRVMATETAQEQTADDVRGLSLA